MSSVIRSFSFFLFVLSSFIDLKAQCDQEYNWAVWSDFSGNSAVGTITQGGQNISVEVSANYNFSSTPGIYNFGTFSGFPSVIPNSTVPRTTWSAGVGGETTMCFSETVSNPVLLLSSLGSPGTNVTLELSSPYQVVYDGGGMDYLSDTTIYGFEGYAILLFPGDFDCLTIYSSTPENYTNLTWGLNPPLFPVSLSGDYYGCDSTTIVASGGSTYEWSGGVFPDSSANTFLESGSYFLTVTDDLGCEVVSSLEIQLDTLCTDCLGVVDGTAVLDDCGECLEPTDPLFNASCTDCLGVVNGTAILDDCGECLEPTDPLFNASCTDCLGVVDGTAELDDCGECLDPSSPMFNQSCADCNGVPNGSAVIDNCGVCLEPTDLNFNLSCFYDFDFYIPNIFSPNNDGINDRFEIYTNINYEIRVNEFSIYDRWGSLVYQVKDLPLEGRLVGWNGQVGSEKAQVGVYLYLIEIEFLNGAQRVFKGDMTLVK